MAIFLEHPIPSEWSRRTSPWHPKWWVKFGNHQELITPQLLYFKGDEFLPFLGRGFHDPFRTPDPMAWYEIIQSFPKHGSAMWWNFPDHFGNVVVWKMVVSHVSSHVSTFGHAQKNVNLFRKDISFWESHLPMSNPRFTDVFFRLLIEVFHWRFHHFTSGAAHQDQSGLHHGGHLQWPSGRRAGGVWKKCLATMGWWVFSRFSWWIS